MVTLERVESTVTDTEGEPAAPEVNYLASTFPRSNVFIDTGIYENTAKDFLLIPQIKKVPVVHAIFDNDSSEMIQDKEGQLKDLSPNQIGLEFALGLIESIAIGKFKTKMNQLTEDELKNIENAHSMARSGAFGQVSDEEAKQFIQPTLYILNSAHVERVTCAVSKIEKFGPTVQHGFLRGMTFLHELGFANFYVFSGDRSTVSSHPSFVQDERSLAGIPRRPTMYHPHAG